MSKNWKHWAADELETTNKFDILKIAVPDFSTQDFLDSKHVLKVYFKPSRKKSGLLISTTSVQACLYEKWPLKSKSMSPTLTPTEFSTLTYYHQFAHRLEIHLYSDKTVDTWDSNRHEFAKTWHFKHTDPEKILYRMFHIGKNIYCFILRYNGVVSSLKVTLKLYPNNFNNQFNRSYR